MRKPTFRPDLMTLESRWLPTAGPYPDAIRNDLQASYVAEADAKSNDVVFLGDSITYYWGTSTRLGLGNSAWDADFATLNAANFGIGGDTTQNVIDRINGGDLNGQPKLVVLMIGVNDLTHGATADETAWNIVNVVATIREKSPESKVLLLGVLPTDLDPVNPEIEQVNSLISGLGSLPGVTYLNPGPAFQQADGSAQPDLLMDAVHPDATGYQLLASEIDGTVLAILNGVDQAPVSTPTPVTTSPVTTSPTSADPIVESSTPDFALIPVAEPAATPTLSPVDPSNSHPKSFATELIDASSS